MECTLENLVILRKHSIQVGDIFYENKHPNYAKTRFNGTASQDILNFAMNHYIEIDVFALEDNSGDITILGKFGNDALQTFYEFLKNRNFGDNKYIKHFGIIDAKIVNITVIRCNNKQSVIDDYIKNLEMFGLINLPVFPKATNFETDNG